MNSNLNSRRLRSLFLTLAMLIGSLVIQAQKLSDFNYLQTDPMIKPVKNLEQFNGYTKYWHNNYSEWFRYGNLFKIGQTDVEKTILQSKLDIAEELGLPGLLMQEGFLSELLSEEYKLLKNTNEEALATAVRNGNILVLSNPESEFGAELFNMAGFENQWPVDLKSHQYNAADFNLIHAFYLTDGQKKIFVISSKHQESIERLLLLIDNTRRILSDYKMYKGWFGAKSLLKSVTCTPGHPLEIIGKGMNEGCSWFVFDGYMDFIAQNELTQWMNDVQLPVVADVGFSPIYACRDFEGLQVQDMATKEAWFEYARSKGGYVFKPVYDLTWDGAPFDGFVAIEGNKEQIDNEDVPFVAESGFLADNLTTSMVLFIEKSKLLSKESIWEAIMDRREVAVLEKAIMMGPAYFRNALQLMYLDRVYLEDYFGDRLDLEAHVDAYNLKINLTNLMSHPVSGRIHLQLPSGLKIAQPFLDKISLPAHGNKQISIALLPDAEAMNYTNPIAVTYIWDDHEKKTLTMMDMPPAISLHKLLYANENNIHYPVSIHNFSSKENFKLRLDVYNSSGSGKSLWSEVKDVQCATSEHIEVPFDFKLKPGSYRVVASALGTTAEGQLGVDAIKGHTYLYEVDLNSDGIMEYRMENDSVLVTLLTTGARVIEYIVKSREDNVLFKIWPKKAIDDARPFRKRGFYPYGGFEDFLGQGSMETHRIYDARIVKKEGEYVQVIMETDYFGNRLQKTFTLYGNSPLLEVRFALDFKNPEANVIGPQPILELGEVHGTEDVFTAPTLDGLKEYRMRPEQYFGAIIHLKEGWNAGYDTKADVNFVGAFPVDQPLFLHMWMNHPSNGESHHYYVEFQPWVPIIQKNTFYFSYFLWGSGGAWQNGVEELRKRNLVSVR